MGTHYPVVRARVQPCMKHRVASRVVGFIQAETVVARAPLCPELRLRLVTDACRLWRATDRDLEALAIEDPFWAFAWAGGQALARYLLDHPEEVRGRRVFDFACGGAIEAIAAAQAGARRVVANDIDPWALEAARMNAELNRVSLETLESNVVGQALDDFDVILAGDAFYASDAELVLDWLRELARAGKRVLLAEPGRGFIDPSGLLRLAEYQAPEDEDTDGTRLRPTGVYSPRL